MFVAVADDILGKLRAKAGNIHEQLLAGGIDLDADVVDAADHDIVETAFEHGLGRHRADTGRRRWTLGSILTSSASGSISRRPIETAPRTVTS